MNDQETRANEHRGTMWLNALMCVRPSDDFAAQVGREVIAQVMRDGIPKVGPLDPYRLFVLEVSAS